MQNEFIMDTLKDIAKKIADLKEFHAAVIIKTIVDYEREGVEQLFIDQQKIQLNKVYDRIAELEEKARRLLERL